MQIKIAPNFYLPLQIFISPLLCQYSFIFIYLFIYLSTTEVPYGLYTVSKSRYIMTYTVILLDCDNAPVKKNLDSTLP